MNSRRITPEQLDKLVAELPRQVRYHNRIVERMQMLQLPIDDPLWIYGLRCRDEPRGLLNIARGCAVEARRER